MAKDSTAAIQGFSMLLPPNAAPLVFRMLDDGTAHDGDLGRGIEQRKIDADLRAVERGLIFRVEKTRIVLRHHRGLAGAVNRRAVKLHPAIALELGQQGLRLDPRQQHGMAEVPPAALAAEHRREKQALIDLEAALVALDGAVLGGDLLRRRNEARHHARGAEHQLLDPHEARPPHRQCIVDGIAMAAEKAHAGVARRILNRGGRSLLAGVAPWLRRQPSDETRGCPPIAGERLAVGGKIGSLARFRLQPGLDLAGG